MKHALQLAVAAAICSLGASAFGDTIVTHDPNAPTSNFQAPTNTTVGPGYSIQVQDDGTNYHVLLNVTDHAESSIGNFANLYFDTDPAANNGSDVGFEVTNGRFFIPGADGYYDPGSDLTVDATHSGVIDVSIANSFFTSGGVDGAVFPAATGNVVLRLSQSFAFSVAGGDSYGPDRLGAASVAAPLPAPAWAGLALFGSVGIIGGAKRLRRQYA